MASRDEIVDQIAGFALFADLATPQLERVAHTFEERGLRGGRAGAAPGPVRLGVPRHPRRRRGGRHRRRASGRRSSRGDFFGEVSILLGEPPGRRRRRAAHRSAASSSPGRQVQPFLLENPPSCTGCSRRRRAGCGTRTGGGADRPPVPAGFVPGRRRRERAGRPPGLVLPRAGSASTTPCCRPTTRRAACSGAGRSSSASCRGRSRTRPVAATDPGLRALRLEQPPGRRAREPGDHAGRSWTATSYFPSRPEMQANLETFAERTGIRVRYGCRWTATRREPAADGETLRPRDDRRRVPRRRSWSSRSASPSRTCRRRRGSSSPPTTPTRGPAETYADKRVFIIGKQNSGFELASGLLPWARRIVLASPSPAKLSVNTRSLVGVRARYVQPFEDHVLGGGVADPRRGDPGGSGGFRRRRSRSAPDRPRAATSSRSRSTR